MPLNTAAENVLGTIGTICWIVQPIPQIWKSWRDKSTEGFAPGLVLLWGIGSPFLGVYNIVHDLNIPLILQPQVFGVLAFVSWGQCMYYGRKWSRARSTAAAVFLTVLAGAFEAGMVFAVRSAYNKGNDRPAVAFGIISTVLLTGALVPQYYEIYRHREVIGISILAMVVDLSGGLFSDLSLVFGSHFDIVAGVTYSLVILLDGILLVLAIILNPLAERRRRGAAHALSDLSNLATSELPARAREDPISGQDQSEIIYEPRPAAHTATDLERAFGDTRMETRKKVA